MFSPEGWDFFSGITWQQVVRHAVIGVTCTWLGWWVLKKYRKL